MTETRGPFPTCARCSGRLEGELSIEFFYGAIVDGQDPPPMVCAPCNEEIELEDWFVEVD